MGAIYFVQVILTLAVQRAMNDIKIEDLSKHSDWIPVLAHWHFSEWGELTGTSAEAEYAAMLARFTSASTIPTTLVAVGRNKLLGSANLVECDMDIRPELHPWLAQVFVDPPARRKGIGAALVKAATVKCRECGYNAVYLYTSGTLPRFYERLGWIVRETVIYKGKERTVMVIRLTG